MKHLHLLALTLALTTPAALAQDTPTSKAPSSKHVSPSGPLERTHWHLISLGDTILTADTTTNEPYIQLDPETHRVSGSSGCNRIMGTYQLTGSKLKFGPLAGTRMACPKGMETEQSFLKALADVTTWKITAGQLNLLDANGHVIAQFKAAQR